MKHNVLLVFYSSLIWIFLVSFFNHVLIWKITFVATVLFSVKFIIDLYLQNRLIKVYGIDFPVTFDEKVKTVLIFSPPISIFIIVTILSGKSVVFSPTFAQGTITFLIGLWFACIESYIFTNAFMHRVIKYFLE